eukprot:jgi/Botrbrau1/15760/Bobra.4_1s0124.1
MATTSLGGLLCRRPFCETRNSTLHWKGKFVLHINACSRAAHVCQASGGAVYGDPAWWQSSQQPLSADELWAQGYADCEADSCGLVPDGALVLVPFALQPKAREERIDILEKGVQLEDDGRLTIGAVPSSRTRMMLVDIDVVSGQHARIEGVQQEGETENSWWEFGKQARPKVRYYITDLESKNGTYVNRARIRPLIPVEIKPGDVLAFGDMKIAYRVVQAWAPKKGFGR